MYVRTFNRPWAVLGYCGDCVNGQLVLRIALWLQRNTRCVVRYVGVL